MNRIVLWTAISSIIAPASLLAQSSATVVTPDCGKNREVTVEAVSNYIFKVTNAIQGEKPLPSRASVITEPFAGASQKKDFDKTVISIPGGVDATLYNNGEVVINGGARCVVSDLGLRPLADGKQELTLYTTSRGSFYGAGERGHKLNLRGDTLVMYNRQNYGYTGSDPRISQMNITMPLFLSNDGFALVFDDYAAAKLVLGKDGEIKYITENPRPISYYYIKGAHSLADVVEHLTELTGRQPLPPLWSLGYITSKYGYHTQAETLGVVDTLKRAGYPLDGIVLDLYWYGKEQDMGRLEWEPSQWPNPVKMLSDLKKKGVNLVAISQPYVLRNGRAIDNYNALAPKGMFVSDSTGTAPQEVKIWVGEGGMFDVSNPETRTWLRNRYKDLTDMGVGGWWGDLGEPEVHPETGMHANGLTARLYHNQYGNDWSEIISDLFREQYADRRLLTMMRGGTIGLQRYSVFPWSTDVSRSWGGLQPQVKIMLNSGLSGLGYMGHDVGGFAVDPANPEDAELYVRWLQLGTFSPMLRTHAQFKAEPYHYPQYAKIIKQLVLDRYRWLPYNYTLAWENATKGYPLVRPLNFYDASNAYDSIFDEYLWGPDVLVAPVMEQGATEREVVFPAGSDWVDFANPRNVYSGGTTVLYPAPLEVLPLFVRAGAIIPMAEYKMNSTADYNPGRLTVRYFPAESKSSSFTMYDDNRMTPDALAIGEFRLLTFSADNSAEQISLKVAASEQTYPGAPAKIDITFLVEGLAKAPAAVTVDGKKVKTKYNAATGELSIVMKFVPAPGAPANVEIKF